MKQKMANDRQRRFIRRNLFLLHIGNRVEYARSIHFAAEHTHTQQQLSARASAARKVYLSPPRESPKDNKYFPMCVCVCMAGKEDANFL